MTTRLVGLLAVIGAGSALIFSPAVEAPGPQQGLERLAGGGVLPVGADRVAAGMAVTLRDSVPGDAMATGGQVTVAAPVAGDVLGAGGMVDVRGRVGGSVRAAGGQVQLRSTVGRNVTLAGGDVRIGDEGEIGGNAYLAGGSIEVSGPVRGSVLAGGGEVRLGGAVEGDVRVAADHLSLGPGARIRGDLTYQSPSVLDRAPDAVVDGAVTRKPMEEPPVPGWVPQVGGWVGGLLGLAAFLFTGLVLGALFPKSAGRLLESGREKPLPSLGIGLIALLAVPALLLASLITVVGIPLALAAGALFAFAVYVARGVLALWIGDAVLGERAGRGRRRVLLDFLVGGALLFLVGVVPWLGALVKVLATAFGLGAATVALRDARISEASGAGGAATGEPGR